MSALTELIHALWRKFLLAVTTWNYHPQRGFLVNKRYADSPASGGQAGPTYLYKPSGSWKVRSNRIR